MKTMNVIGAGISGSCAKLIGEELGWRINLIDQDSKKSASRAALATIRPTWFDKEGRASAEISWNWYEKWGAAVTRSGIVSSYRKPQESKVQQDWWLVDPWIMLQEPDIKSAVTGIEGTTCQLDNGEEIHADALLIATGWHDQSYKPLHGATLLSKDNQFRNFLHIHHLRPYHSVMVASWNGTTRLGSSISPSKDKAIAEVFKMLEAAKEIGIVDQNATWELFTGIRSKSKDNKPFLPVEGNPIGIINGLHRSGYALAPDAIHRWIRSL
jgi:glycine/D-amino acid oxidase-like deaminating enzyme